MMGRVKQIMWLDIIEFVNDIWPSIQIIFEQRDLIEVVKIAIEKTNEELGDKPQTANKIIRFLNSKSNHELEQLEVADRTTSVLEDKRVLNKIGRASCRERVSSPV